jgi:peptidoglycan hydrolase-like protein with peptidoglycan-binding domain
MIRLVMAVAAALLVASCAETRSSGPAPIRSSSASPALTAPQPSPEVREAQERLRRLGLYSGPVDGLWGPETRSAMERFQRGRGMAVTARLDDPTLAAIRAAETAPLTLSDPTDVRTVQNRLRQLGAYNGADDGVWGRDTQAAIEHFQHSRGLPVGSLTEGTIMAMGLDPASFAGRTPGAMDSRDPLDRGVVQGVQQRLRELGFYGGAVDGVWGAGTTDALSQFQRSRGLEASGQLNPATASALGLDPNNLAASAPVVR